MMHWSVLGHMNPKFLCASSSWNRLHRLLGKMQNPKSPPYLQYAQFHGQGFDDMAIIFWLRGGPLRPLAGCSQFTS
jgi:hypothetical protein